jgi:hypothetical protein
MAQQEIQDRFRSHSVSPEWLEIMDGVRSGALGLAQFIDEEVPRSREQSLALTKLEEVVFWANAAIARNQGE